MASIADFRTPVNPFLHRAIRSAKTLTLSPRTVVPSAVNVVFCIFLAIVGFYAHLAPRELSPVFAMVA